MAEERFILTRAGYETLRRELVALESQRQERLEQLADVQNDTSEDTPELAAYYEVATMKEHLDERIGHLKFVLERAQVRDEDPNPHLVDPGERVTVWDFEAKREIQFDVLSSPEIANTYANDDGRYGVSLSSPVGQALVGRQIGDIIEIEVPDGIARYAIRRIEAIPGEI